MSTKRKGKKLSDKRLAKASRRTAIFIWIIIIIVLVSLVAGTIKTFGFE